MVCCFMRCAPFLFAFGSILYWFLGDDILQREILPITALCMDVIFMLSFLFVAK